MVCAMTDKLPDSTGVEYPRPDCMVRGRASALRGMVWCLAWATAACYGSAPAARVPGCADGKPALDVIYFSKYLGGRGYSLGVYPETSVVTRPGRMPVVLSPPLCQSDINRPIPSLLLACVAPGGSEADQGEAVYGSVRIRPWPEDPRALNVVDPADWFSIAVRGLSGWPPYFLADGMLTIARGEAVHTVAARVRRESLSWSVQTKYEILLPGADITKAALSAQGKFLVLIFDAANAFRMEARYRVDGQLGKIIAEMASQCPS